MNQELLKRACKTIIKSRESTAVATLKEMIRGNKKAITDEKSFYAFILDCLASNLHLKSGTNHLAESYLDVLSLEKLTLFRTIASSNKGLGNAFNKTLLKLARYEAEQVDNLIADYVNKDNLDNETRKYFASYMGSISENKSLVRKIIKRINFNEDFITIICGEISETNTRINALICEENNTVNSNNHQSNSSENKKEKRRIEVIYDLTRKRDSLIVLVNRVIEEKGVESFTISEQSIISLLKSENIGYGASCDWQSKSILEMILESKETMNKLDKKTLVEYLTKVRLRHYAIMFMAKMSGEELSKLETLNSPIEELLNRADIDKNRQLLKIISESELLYKLEPNNIITLLEYICSSGIDEESIVGYKLRFKMNEEQRAELNRRLIEAIKRSAEADIKTEHFYEKFVISLFDSEYSEDAIIYILQNFGIDISYRPISDEGPISIGHLIYSSCSKEIKKAFVNIPNITSNVKGFIDTTDMFNMCLEAGEYSKAADLFENPNFSWLRNSEANALDTRAKYEIEYECFEYQDSLTQAVHTICGQFDKHPILIELLRHIISSDKTKYIAKDALELIMIIEDEETIEIVKNRYCEGDIKFIDLIGDELDGYDGVMVMSREEVKTTFPTIAEDKIQEKGNVMEKTLPFTINDVIVEI